MKAPRTVMKEAASDSVNHHQVIKSDRIVFNPNKSTKASMSHPVYLFPPLRKGEQPSKSPSPGSCPLCLGQLIPGPQQVKGTSGRMLCSCRVIQGFRLRRQSKAKIFN